MLSQSLDALAGGIYDLVAPSDERKVFSSIWERVVLLKKDELGHEIQTYSKCPREYRYILHNPTGLLFLDEAKATVWLKCAILALVSPVFMGMHMLWSAARILIDISAIAIRSLSNFIQRRISLEVMAQALKEISGRSYHQITKLVIAPLCLIGMELSALLGLVLPYEGRRFFSYAESLFFQSVGTKELYCSWCYLDRVQHPQDLLDIFSRKEVFFLAACFQPRGILREKVANQLKYRVLQRNPVILYK